MFNEKRLIYGILGDLGEVMSDGRDSADDGASLMDSTLKSLGKILDMTAEELTRSEEAGGLEELQDTVAKKLEKPLSPAQQEAAFNEELDSLHMIRESLVKKISSLLPKITCP